jgi:hypothetical protein
MAARRRRLAMNTLRRMFSSRAGKAEANQDLFRQMTIVRRYVREFFIKVESVQAISAAYTQFCSF